MAESQYPSNSHKSRAEGASKPGAPRDARPTPEEPRAPKQEKLENVTTASVRKKSLGRRIKESFVGDDAQTVGNYVLMDVIVPAAKDMIADAVKGAVERMLFGDSSRSRSSHSSRGSGYNAYNRMYSNKGNARDDGSRTMSRTGRARHEFTEIVLADRGEAETVLFKLTELIENFDVAAVSDLLDLVGVTGSFTDEKYGWTDLRGSGVRRVRDGYILDLPNPEPI